MNVLVRADASLQIGSGHVIRCLTLAEVLRNRGSNIQFVCRDHQGNMLEQIQARGFRAHGLQVLRQRQAIKDESPYASWLGADIASDLKQTLKIANEMQADWILVDHYAIDEKWEKTFRSLGFKVMVIDDLADRAHDSDLLLDQNLGRDASDYVSLISTGCNILAGSKYTLLRPEFAELRNYSLQYKKSLQLKRILITMGGVDNENVTTKILKALSLCTLPEDCKVTVVMGPFAPGLNEVRTQAGLMPCPTEVLVSSNEMAQLMAESSIAIGALGGTAWERCCMGLPTIAVILAENQKVIARALYEAGAILLLEVGEITVKGLQEKIKYLNDPHNLLTMQRCASAITDGYGAERVAEQLQDAC